MSSGFKLQNWLRQPQEDMDRALRCSVCRMPGRLWLTQHTDHNSPLAVSYMDAQGYCQELLYQRPLSNTSSKCHTQSTSLHVFRPPSCPLDSPLHAAPHNSASYLPAGTLQPESSSAERDESSPDCCKTQFWLQGHSFVPQC